MSTEPSAVRAAWAAVLFAALTAVVLNFVLTPVESPGDTPGGAAHLTFWVPDAQVDVQTESLAAQAAGAWTLGHQPSTVGVLDGGAVDAVTRFLTRARGPGARRENLLVLTSSTVAQMSSGDAGGPVRRLSRIPLVAVIATEPLQLAVTRRSTLDSAAQVMTWARRDPGRKLFGVADDAWLEDNLAALAARGRLRGRLPYEEYGSSAAAVGGLETGETRVVIAPHSALTPALRAHEVRILGWPGRPPMEWVAIAAAPGVSRRDLRSLRRQATHLDRDRRWRRLLQGEGLRVVHMSTHRLTGFLGERSRVAGRLHALADRLVVD